MEPTFCLSRQLCTKPIFTTPFSRPTIVHFHMDLSFHRHCSLRGRTLQSWPTQKAHRKTLAVNSLPVPKDRNGGDGEGKPTKLVRMTVVLACVLGAICMSGMVGPRAVASTHGVKHLRHFLRSSPKVGRDRKGDKRGTTGREQMGNRMEEVQPGLSQMLQKSLKAFLEAQMSELEKVEDQAKTLDKLIQDDQSEPYKLQKVAHKLKMTHRAKAMVDALQKKYTYFCNKKMSEEARNLGLILAEMRIYQGEYEEYNKAKDLLEVLVNEIPSDPRPQLYLAAAHMMLGKDDSARKSWSEFELKASIFLSPPSDDGDGQPSFEEFKSCLHNLKNKIEKPRK